MIVPAEACDPLGQLSPIITDTHSTRAAPANWSGALPKGVPNTTALIVPESRDNRRQIHPLFGETWKLPRAPRVIKCNKPAGDRHQRPWTEFNGEKKLEFKNITKILSQPSIVSIIC